MGHCYCRVVPLMRILWDAQRPVKRGILHMGRQRHKVGMASGDFPLRCAVLTSVFGRAGSQAVITAPRSCFRGPFLPKEFPLCWCPSSGSRAAEQQTQVAVWEACWILLGILSCLQPLSASLLFTSRSFSSPLSWWNVFCVQVPLC